MAGSGRLPSWLSAHSSYASRKRRRTSPSFSFLSSPCGKISSSTGMLKKVPETSISESHSACCRAIARSVAIYLHNPFFTIPEQVSVTDTATIVLSLHQFFYFPLLSFALAQLPGQTFRHQVGHSHGAEARLWIGEALLNAPRLLR